MTGAGRRSAGRSGAFHCRPVPAEIGGLRDLVTAGRRDEETPDRAAARWMALARPRAAKPRCARRTPPLRVLLDTGALLDAERHPCGQTFTACRRLYDEGIPPLLPTVVLAQVWRGRSRQHGLAELRALCRLLPFTESAADDVGLLLARSGTADIVEAAVVAGAVEHGTAVMTTTPADLRRLIEVVECPVPLITV